MSVQNEKLIEEAAKAIVEVEYPDIAWGLLNEKRKEFRRRQARATLAVFEKAHTPADDFPHGHPELDAPTDDEREALVAAYLEEHGHHADARHGFLVGLATGFRRSAVPEPSAGEDEFTPGECDGSGKCPAEMHVHGCYMPHRADQCDSPDEYGHLPAEPQGEPSDAVLKVFEDEWYRLDYVTEPERHRRALTAALRAASAVTEQGESR